MLSDWLPFLIYALFAAAIPASMLLFSFVFATRPSTRTKQRTLPFESGVSRDAPGLERQVFVVRRSDRPLSAPAQALYELLMARRPKAAAARRRTGRAAVRS